MINAIFADELAIKSDNTDILRAYAYRALKPVPISVNTGQSGLKQ